jgi:hypothetical protein
MRRYTSVVSLNKCHKYVELSHRIEWEEVRCGKVARVNIQYRTAREDRRSTGSAWTGGSTEPASEELRDNRGQHYAYSAGEAAAEIAPLNRTSLFSMGVSRRVSGPDCRVDLPAHRLESASSLDLLQARSQGDI